MTATLVKRSSPALACFALLISALEIGVKASEVIPAGAIAALDTSGRLVNCTADVTLRVVGRCEEDVTGSLVDRAVLGKVKPGVFLLDNGDSIAAADIGKPCYAGDNQTVYKSDAGGTRPFAGIITQIQTGSSGPFDAAQGGVYVAMLSFFDPSQASKNDAGGDGPAFIQRGTGTLVAGVLNVAAGVQLTASSVIVALRKEVGGTAGDTYDAPAADRIVGEPGVAGFKIRSYTAGTVAASADTSTVDWIIIG